MRQPWTGVGTALVTPFTRDGALDEGAVRRLARRQLDGGVRFLVPCGTTGESPTLTHEEHLRVVELVLEEARGRAPVLAGAGGYNTDEVSHLARELEDLGVQGILSVTPYYNKPTQDGLVRHYETVASHTTLPIVLYNVPGRTGCDLLPETAAALAGHERIIGIKEARAEAGRMDALLPLRGEGFAVFSGDDPTAAEAMLAGADGVVSVASNLLPRAMRRLCDLARAARETEARELDAQLQPVFTFLGVEPNPIPLKAVLARMQFGHGLRLPLTTLSPMHAGEADLVATRIQQLEQACRDLLAA